MAPPTAPTPDVVLRLCAEAAPEPWRPSAYARAAGVDRDALDEPLNRLRLAGLVRIADWQPGVGQGYALTEAGTAAVGNGRALAKLRAGTWPAAEAAAGPPAAAGRTAYDRGEAVRDALFGQRPASVTYTLIAVQLLVFIA